MRKTLAKILAIFSKLFLWRYRPKIVAITGSVGKTSTKEAVGRVLSTRYSVRLSLGNYNNEIGVPLTILGEETADRNFLGWLWIFLKSLGRFVARSNYPQILVLELGVDRPGNIALLLRILGQVDVAVITDIGISHLQFFNDQSALAREKLSLIKKLRPTATAVLNFDSPKVLEGRIQTKAKVIGFGFSDEADVRGSDFRLTQSEGTWGSNFKVHYKGTMIPFFLPNSLGKPGAIASLAAVATGLQFDINPVDASEALKSYQPPQGRQRLIEGINCVAVIDDTYNAAPASVVAALETLSNLAAGRKLAAIGAMAELGPQTRVGHEEVAVQVLATGVNLLFLVGEDARIIQDELGKRGFAGQMKWFPDSDAAKAAIKNSLLPEDTILVKGSQSARMEKIVKEIMLRPEQAADLLVRQTDKWL